MIDHIIDYAAAGQPLMIAACSQPGATSPVTLAGTLVVDGAQVLAGLVLTQLLAPGLPVIMGSTSTSCDLRSIAPSIGSPETGLITVAFKALCRRYGVPCRSGGTLTDSKDTDMQAGIEGAMAMMPAILSGVDFVLHACGTMESFTTVCLEKFIIDEETTSAMLRMQKGFEFDDETLAADCIKEVGIGGNFLTHDHTLDNFRSELFMPSLFSKESFPKWEEAGKKDLTQVAGERLKQRLAAYKFPSITETQEKLLQKYFEK
jgi:trimethylamine--corrinoid protein Co-methyltransferase